MTMIWTESREATRAAAKELEAVVQPAEQEEAGKPADAIPNPCGARLLCVVPEIDEKFADSSIVKADTVIDAERQTTNVLFVLREGPDAYKDAERFPTGPWCRKGDFVLVRTYAGTRFKVFDKEFRLIYDDEVCAVVSDPRAISKV